MLEDVVFEKKSALFAIAVSDVVIINMWYKDIGLENAANRPLLKIIFQMMMRLFPENRATLFFVIRDSEVDCSEILVEHLKKDINKIYDSIKLKDEVRSLSDLFDVEVTTFSNYRLQNTEFKEQVVGFRQKIVSLLASCAVARGRNCLLPTSAFSDTWDIIRKNKDLDLPTLTDMIATTRCVNIADAKFSQFSTDQDWLEQKNNTAISLASDFGEKINAIINRYLSEYKAETIYFDGITRTEKLQNLLEKMLTVIQPAYKIILENLSLKCLYEFKEEFDIDPKRKDKFADAAEDCKASYLSQFDGQCKEAAITQAKWSSSENRIKLASEMDAYAALARDSAVLELKSSCEESLAEELSSFMDRQLKEPGVNTWSSIRGFLLDKTELSLLWLRAEISGFKLDELEVKDILAQVGSYARKRIQKKAKVYVRNLELHMMKRFGSLFSSRMPCNWTGNEDIESFTLSALSSCLEMLSVMAIVRLDGEPDHIGEILSGGLLPGAKTLSNGLSPDTGNVVIAGSNSSDPLSLTTWEEVPSQRTLITPVGCKLVWEEFLKAAKPMVDQAFQLQIQCLKANKAKDSAAVAEAELKAIKVMAIFALKVGVTVVAGMATAGVGGVVAAAVLL